MSTIGIVNSIDTDKKIGVAAYASNEVATTVANSGVYFPIANAFENVYIECFTAIGDPAIRYDGAATMVFEVDWHAVVASETSGRTVEIGFKKNGALVTGSNMCTLCKTAGEQYALSGTMAVELAATNTIQLVLTADADGEDITVKHFTTTIRPFFW